MEQNNDWDLILLPEGYKQVGCKWVFKTKPGSKVNIERYKGQLGTKGYTEKDSIDHKKKSSSISKKDLFQIIITLIAL